MADTKPQFNFLWAVLGGIVFWILFTLLDSTSIFSAVANLPAIGLFLGVLVGGFKDKLNLF